MIDSDGVIIGRMVHVRTPYNYNVEAASYESGTACVGPSKTQQQFAEESNINTIVRRFGLTGELPRDVAVPQSGDFTNVVDFQSALNLVLEAERAFSAMPADVRKRFGHDPAEFLAFVHDDKNREEAQKLGLLLPPKVPAPPLEVRVIPDEPKA